MTPLPRDRQRREITIGLSLVYMMSFNAVFSTFGTGQVNFVVLFTICLALAALRQNAAPWRVALPLSVAILLKTYPVLLLLLLLWRKQFRIIAYTCGILAVFTAIAAFALPPHIWHSWSTAVESVGLGYANGPVLAGLSWNQSINAFVTRLFQENFFSKAPLFYPLLTKPTAVVLSLLVVGVTAFFSFRAWRQSSRDERGEDAIAACLLMTYLVAPLSWDHHLVYIFPVAALAISLLVSGSVRGRLAVIVAASLLLLAWRFPIDRPDITQGWWTLLMSAKLYPVVLLWLFFIHRLRRSGSALASGELPQKSLFGNETGAPQASWAR